MGEGLTAVLLPVAWLVRALSHLPDSLRVGAACAVGVLLVWFVARGGLVSLWHGVIRWSAAVAAAAVALALEVEYYVTTARRRRGMAPYAWAIALADPVERVQGAAAAIWAAHAPRPRGHWRRTRMPWLLAILLVVTGAAAWELMTRLDPATETTYQLSRAFQEWRGLENWADVPEERRAAPGPALDADGHAPKPRLVHVDHRPGRIRVRLRCARIVTCRSEVRVLTSRGRIVTTELVRLAPAARTTLSLRARHGARVTLARAD